VFLGGRQLSLHCTAAHRNCKSVVGTQLCEKPELTNSSSVPSPVSRRRVLMLLSNCFNPDPRVQAEARSLAQNGYEVLILAWDRERQRPMRELVDDILVERIRIRSVHNRGATQTFYIAAANAIMALRGLRYRFDVVHAHDFDTLPAAYFLGSPRRKPVIYDSHEDYAGMLHGFVPVWMQQCIRWVENRFVSRVDLLITVGERLRRHFELRGCRRSVVVGNWKAPNEFKIVARGPYNCPS
jgi:Glycosyl transferase 4-like domain